MGHIKNFWLRLDQTGRVMLLMIPAILSGVAIAIISETFSLGMLGTLGVACAFLAPLILIGLPLAFVPEVRKRSEEQK
jgi:Zn-dependent protease